MHITSQLVTVKIVGRTKCYGELNSYIKRCDVTLHARIFFSVFLTALYCYYSA